MQEKSVPRSHEFVRVLSIAGSDSGGGAGIQADLKTFAALGCFGMSAITAVTAQNTFGVHAIQGVQARVLAAQIDAVLQDMGAHAIKIGMLHAPQSVRTVARALRRYDVPPVVLDPVLLATSGTALLHDSAVSLLVQQLFGRATLVTPNLDEAALLVGRPLHSEADMQAAAEQLLGMGARAVLLKGGHLAGPVVSDLLLLADGSAHWMRAERIASANTHGTGCTLSSAIAAQLALGASLLDAVHAARAFVRAALAAAAPVRTGAGNGALNHGFAPQALWRRPLAP